jgi:flagellar biosynthesis/type III secretory pathway chaperone
MPLSTLALELAEWEKLAGILELENEAILLNNLEQLEQVISEKQHQCEAINILVSSRGQISHSPAADAGTADTSAFATHQQEPFQPPTDLREKIKENSLRCKSMNEQNNTLLLHMSRYIHQTLAILNGREVETPLYSASGIVEEQKANNLLARA